MMKFAILGGGSWGSALAIHLAHKHEEVKVWEFVEVQAQEMQQQRVCRLLPHEKLKENIFVSHKLEEVLPGSEAILIVVPSDKVESTLQAAESLIKNNLSNPPLIICSKGFASELRLLSEILSKMFPQNNLYGLYGPTHAEEVCKGKFSGIVLAGNGAERKKLKKELEAPFFKVELCKDLIGVQVAAALKNILAVFVGVLDSLDLGDNARAYIMAKGTEEIAAIGMKWGGKRKTFLGLAGMGDIIVTCSSQHSRNRYVGEQIGKGRNLDDILAEMKMVAEGVTAAKYIPQLREKFNLRLPVLSGLYQILFAGKNPVEVLHKLK